jgi:hypothetical protein
MKIALMFLLTLFCVSLRAETDWNTVVFNAEPLRNGTSLRLSTNLNINVFGGSTQSLRIEKTRESWVLEADNMAARKLKVAYSEVRTSSSFSSIKNEKPSVSGKTYLVSIAAGNPTITTVTGSKVSEKEAAYLKQDFIALGKPHPIALMLHGQKLKMGDELGSIDVLKTIITENLSGVGVGEVKSLSARLISRQKFNKLDTAIIWLNLETGSSKLFADSSAKLSGQLVVAIPSGLPVAFKLDGNMSVYSDLDHDSSKSKAQRGTLSFVAIGELTLPPVDRTRTDDDDDDYIIWNGNRVRNARR